MANNKINLNTLLIFLINIVAVILAYYISILLHEWGHGTVAWLYGMKESPFDVQYGGWFLTNVDENVDYPSLINSNRGTVAALIAIAGFTVSFILVVIAFILLNHKSVKNNSIKFILAYWFLIINMIPMVQYLVVSPFSSEGDTGRFVHGLNISGWLVFVPGAIFIIYSIWRILKIEIIKAYVTIPIRSLIGQNIFLLATLGMIFLFIYMHGYNPLTDKGMNTFSKGLALISIFLVPLLFILCNPARKWVKKYLLIYHQKMQ